MKRLKQLFARARRVFPLRAGAVLLLVIAALVVWAFSSREADFLLYPAGLVALGLVVVLTVVTTAGTLVLRRAVKRLDAGLPSDLETTHPSGTGFRFPALRGFLVLDVSLEWVEPTGFEVTLEAMHGQLSEVVTAKERGRFSRVVRRFTVDDLFGLTRVSFDVAWDASLRVAPRAATRSAELAAGRSQGESLANPIGRPEGDLVEMRQYGPGDSMRHVLWKVYARTRKLLVRMPERALSPGPVSVAFFVAGDDDEASAGAARLYVEAGLLGADLVFCADGSPQPARSAREALEVLIDSRSARAHGGEALEAAASQVDPARLTSCLVFAPASDGPWRERLVGFVKRHSLDATVIIGVDEAGERPPPPSRLEALLFAPPDALDSARPALAQLRGALEAEGLPVRVLHRASGMVLS